MRARDPLLSPEFLALGFVIFCAFCQIAMFYGFMGYLARLGIPEAWQGVLVSLEPFTAFLLRPLVAPLIHGGNALRALVASLLLVVLVLLGYPFATTVPILVLVRILHGAAFLLLVSAAITLFTRLMPPGRSGAGFGFMGIATQLPYALMPAVAEAILPLVGSEVRAYAWMSSMGGVALVVLALVTPRLRRAQGLLTSSETRRPTLLELRQDLGMPIVQRLLALNVLLFLASTTVFFFMKGFLATQGHGRVDLFFTVSILAGLVLRLVGVGLFDRFDKVRVLRLALPGLAAVFLLLPWVPSLFYGLAALYGALMAVVFALLNGLMFDRSDARFRGLNANLMMVAMDAGFFLAPVLGGFLLAGGLGPGALFPVCSTLCLAGTLLLKGPSNPAEA